MKAKIAALLLSISVPAFAGPGHHGGHFHGHNHRNWGSGYSWLVPAIIGGAVTYVATRPDPVVVQQPPVVLQPNQVIIDGVIYTKQIAIINGVQQEVLIRY